MTRIIVSNVFTVIIAILMFQIGFDMGKEKALKAKCSVCAEEK